jgi:hypothetical protein
MGLFNLSCEKEEINKDTANSSIKSRARMNLTDKNGLLKTKAEAFAKSQLDCSYEELSKKVADMIVNKAVEPSECGPTPFNSEIDKYIAEFGELEFIWYGEYAAINYLFTLIDDSKQYFGANGQYTGLVRSHEQNLEKFWSMPDEVKVNGQHNSTLNDRDKIAQVYIVFADLTEQEAYDAADEILAINKLSPVFIETPLLSFDAFASPSNLIVLGDGLMQVLSETGISNNVVYTGVLSHEWGHQVQFNNHLEWYGVEFEESIPTPESTRAFELEADFFSGYYLTHKRGATYNWKNAAEFSYLFFNSGDCSFDSDSHHGTPNQRMAAARLGWIIAQINFRNGAILSADELHSIFMAAFNAIINDNMDKQQAVASLKSTKLKVIYSIILSYEKELKRISNGVLDKHTIEKL